MPANFLEMVKVPESDLLKISFSDFIYQVFPQVRDQPEVISTISAIIAGLKPLCIEQKNDIFAYVKKGAMRRFSLGNGWVQDHLISTFEKIEPDLIGDNPEIKEVVAENFFGPMDLDLRIARMQPTNTTEIYSTISETLSVLGFREINLNGKAVLTNSKYRTEIKSVQLGFGGSRTRWVVNIYPLTDNKPVFKLDIIDLPQTNGELNQDVTDTVYASDLDQVLGYIGSQSGKLDLYYNATEGQSDILRQMFEHYFDAASEIFTFSPNLSKYLFQGVREIGQRAMYVNPLLTKFGPWNLKDLIEFKKRNWGEVFPLKNIVSKWIDRQKELLKANHKYLMSCLIGMTSGNIAVGLPLFWLDTYAYLTPLGRLIENYEEFEQFINIILRNFDLSVDSPLGLIAFTYIDQVLSTYNFENLGAFLMIDALKEMEKIPKNTPRTLSSVASLLDPLLLADATIPLPTASVNNRVVGITS